MKKTTTPKSLFLNLKSQDGFTLVEMLAAMVAFVVVGGIVTAIIITTFRTTNKTNTLTIVRQNGNYALYQMAKTIRNARVLESPFPCANTSPTPVSSITIKNVDGTNITYSCNITPTPATISSNGASLLDTTVVSLNTNMCKFSCIQTSPTDLPIVTIQFGLSQITSSKFGDQTASTTAIPFQTSVVVRNMTR